MSENPYDSPAVFSDQPADLTPGSERPVGMLAHVPVLAAFMIFQGALCVLGGFSCVLLAIFAAMMVMGEGGPEAPPDMDRETFSALMFAVYAGLGAVVGLPGLVTLWSGIQLLRFKGRVLGMLATFVGLISGLFCYCLPTGMALMIYGLIVLSNAEVRVAFEMRSEGRSFRQIMSYFYGPIQPGQM